jgi:hypothetical protein
MVRVLEERGKRLEKRPHPLTPSSERKNTFQERGNPNKLVFMVKAKLNIGLKIFLKGEFWKNLWRNKLSQAWR